MTGLAFVLAIFATYRLARLVAWDKIFQPLRAVFGRRASGSGFWKFLADLLNCPYCLGIWFAAGITALLRPVDWQQFILAWLAIAGGQFVLQHITDD